MKEILIQYYSGRMNIVCDNFFPTSAANVRKLFKVVCLDYVHRADIAQDILQWMRDQVQQDPILLSQYANAALDAGTKAAEMQPEIEKQAVRVQCMKDTIASLKRDQKVVYTEALKKEKEKLKAMRNYQRDFEKDKRYNTHKYKTCQNQLKRFKENIELIEQLSAGWY